MHVSLADPAGWTDVCNTLGCEEAAMKLMVAKWRQLSDTLMASVSVVAPTRAYLAEYALGEQAVQTGNSLESFAEAHPICQHST